LNCSFIKKIRELGLDRRETGWFVSTIEVVIIFLVRKD